MRTLLVIILLFVVAENESQASPIDAVDRRQTIEIDSVVLGETREIIVQLPEGYIDTPHRNYPVLYLTDAVWQFDLIAAYMDYHAHWGRIPDHIIVGLFNPNRNADLVPRADYRYPATGNGDLYLRHVRDEVLHQIDANFRTNETRILFGHSFGGTMTLNQLLTEPDQFDAYIALGSSTWVADRVLFERLERAAERSFGGAIVYMAVGETDGGATVPDGELFAARLEELRPQGLNWVFEITPGENHFTNVPEGLHRAITHIYPFVDQKVHVEAAGRERGALGIMQWFGQQETQLGWRFHAQSMELSLAGYSLAQSDDLEAAMQLFDELEARFPRNVELVAVRANALGSAGHLSHGIAEMERAISMGENEGHPANRLQAFRGYQERLEGRIQSAD